MFIGNFGYVAVCVVGALLVMNNIITFGVEVIIYTIVFGILMWKLGMNAEEKNMIVDLIGKMKRKFVKN